MSDLPISQEVGTDSPRDAVCAECNGTPGFVNYVPTPIDERRGGVPFAYQVCHVCGGTGIRPVVVAE